MLLTLHHIVTDGWSSGVLSRELSALYAAHCRGEARGLPALPVQYADYAVWQREWLQGEVLEQQLAYWKPALADLPALELPTDRPRPAIASFRGERIDFEIDEALTRRIKESAAREGATLFMTLLAAFQVLLYRYSGQEDIAVGCADRRPRTRPSSSGLIGFFVNTLVLRGDLSGDPSFPRVLARVRARALDAYAHQDLPFEKLVEELHPQRDLSRNPLFQVALAMQNTPQGELRLEGVDVEPLNDICEREREVRPDADSITEVGGALRTRVEYATDLFDAATIERMIGHWRVLLAGIVADPAQPISQLPLLTPDGAATGCSSNGTRRPSIIRASGAFTSCSSSRWSARRDAMAVVIGEQQLTYARAQRARESARASSARAGRRAATSWWACASSARWRLVVAILGILKAGGGLCAARPELSGAAPRVHADGHAGAGAADAGADAGRCCRQVGRDRCASTGTGRRSRERRETNAVVERQRPRASRTSSTRRARPASPRA